MPTRFQENDSDGRSVGMRDDSNAQGSERRNSPPTEVNRIQTTGDKGDETVKTRDVVNRFVNCTWSVCHHLLCSQPSVVNSAARQVVQCTVFFIYQVVFHWCTMYCSDLSQSVSVFVCVAFSAQCPVLPGFLPSNHSSVLFCSVQLCFVVKKTRWLPSIHPCCAVGWGSSDTARPLSLGVLF